LILLSVSVIIAYVGFAVVWSATWWSMDATNGPKLTYWHLVCT